MVANGSTAFWFVSNLHGRIQPVQQPDSVPPHLFQASWINKWAALRIPCAVELMHDPVSPGLPLKNDTLLPCRVC